MAKRGDYRPKPLKGAVAPVEHMRRRADFLAARKGERRGGPLFTIEVLDRSRSDPALRDAPPRLGLTVTKKIGNAPVRNRIRRRLREAVRTSVARDMRPGHDYVVVAKPDAATVAYDDLVVSLRDRVAAPMREPGGNAGGRGARKARGRRRSGSGSPGPADRRPNSGPNGSSTGEA